MYEIAYHDKPLDGLSILVTGGAGFIGSHLCEYLLKHGAKRVVVADNLLTGFRENIELFAGHPRYTFLELDLSDLSACREAVKGIDVICHQAALGSVPRSIKHPDQTIRHNVDAFVNLVLAAHEQGIKRFVYASSSSVYGDEPRLPKVEERIGKPLSPYAISKYTNELFAANFGTLYGMEFIGFRYFNVFGPRQSPKGIYAAVIPLFVEACMKNETVYINGDGGQTRDFTFVENVVQLNVKAMLTDNPDAIGQVYNVGCGENISVLGLYEKIRALSRSTSPVVHRDARAGDVRDSLADTSKAEKLLGYKPLFKLDEGLSITVESFLSSGDLSNSPR
jgi:UDP-N-acetylglucosamine 4-epimerase